MQVATETEPPLGDALVAVGGGPLLVRDGSAYADPDPPSPAEALQIDPQAGALRTADGRLVLVEVDGRARGVSTGLRRAAFGALLEGLGAVDGMAFDSGGSATLVVRPPGRAAAELSNLPSDGRERAVADGLFVYSDAAPGPPSRLAVRPAPVRAVVGAAVPVVAVAIDAAGRPVSAGGGVRAALSGVLEPRSLGTVTDGVLLARSAGLGTLHVRSAGLEADVPVIVDAAPARLRIVPAAPNPEPGSSVAFRALGADRAGAPLAVDGALDWSASAGSVSQDGRFTAGASDATVTARSGTLMASVVVRVGRSTAEVDAFGTGRTWTFRTLPAGGPGSAESEPAAAGAAADLRLSYDFTQAVRAAYATTRMPLPGQPLGLALDVEGDGSGVALRASIETADGDGLAVTLARRVDWTGWRRCHAVLPPTAVAPLALRSLYALPALGGPVSRRAGSLGLRNLAVVVAGTSR